MNVDRAAEIGITVDSTALGGMPTAAEGTPLEDRWIVAQFHQTAANVNQSLENYRYDDAANEIYQFFWGSFCDWYLEIVKLRLIFDDPTKRHETQAALTTLVSVFEASLRLLSPFMPFLTEEIWHALYEENDLPDKSIALTCYPKSCYVWDAKTISAQHPYDKSAFEAVYEMTALQNVISAFRALRKDSGVPEKEFVTGQFYSDPMREKYVFYVVTHHGDIFRQLAKVRVVRLEPLTYGKTRSEANFDLAIDYEAQIDIPAERDRLTKDIAKYEKGLLSAERQLGNEGFLAKAPAKVVEGLKKQEAETRLLLEKARAALEKLKGEK
jgi:valyl-tRNA synthetase